MTFKPTIWRPIAAGLGVINFVAMAFASAAAEPMHAGTHAVLALAFAYWAQRLKPVMGASEQEARLESLEAELGNVRGELSEAQERLDFAERMLAQGVEARRVNPER